MEINNKGEPQEMTIADLLKHLIEENKKLFLENEQLKREVEELKKLLRVATITARVKNQ